MISCNSNDDLYFSEIRGDNSLVFKNEKEDTNSVISFAYEYSVSFRIIDSLLNLKNYNLKKNIEDLDVNIQMDGLSDYNIRIVQIKENSLFISSPFTYKGGKDIVGYKIDKTKSTKIEPYIFQNIDHLNALVANQTFSFGVKMDSIEYSMIYNSNKEDIKVYKYFNDKIQQSFEVNESLFAKDIGIILPINYNFKFYNNSFVFHYSEVGPRQLCFVDFKTKNINKVKSSFDTENFAGKINNQYSIYYSNNFKNSESFYIQIVDTNNIIINKVELKNSPNEFEYGNLDTYFDENDNTLYISSFDLRSLELYVYVYKVIYN